MSMKSRFVCSGLALAFLVTAGCASPGTGGSSSGGKGGSSSSSGGKSGSSGGSNGSGGNNSSSGGNTGSGGSSSSSGGNTGSGGSSTSSGGNTGSGGSSTSSGGNTGSGGSSTSSGGSTGTGGAAGAAAPVKDCVTKTVVMNPIFMNFENYNGMVTVDNYTTAFGGTTVNSGNAYTGIYGYPEATGATAPTMSILAGHPPSMWAGSEQLAATMYGMGGGVWMGCADATAYKGISFWVRGTSGKGTFDFSISMASTQLPSGTNNAGGGTCPGVAASTGVKATCVDPAMTSIPLTQDWSQVTIMWSDFTPGLSGTTSVVPNGDNIVGMAWSVPLAFEADPSKPADAGVYVPVPETLVFDIDDITFIQ